MSDDAYVHDPADFPGSDGAGGGDRTGSDKTGSAGGARSADGTGSADRQGEDPAAGDREFGLRGWILVGWLFVALVVVPGYLFVFPTAGETLSLFGLGYRDTYLFVPLLPAILLGALAVWATTRP